MTKEIITICPECGKENNAQSALWNWMFSHLVCNRCGNKIHFVGQKCICKELEDAKKEIYAAYERESKMLLDNRLLYTDEQFELLWRMHLQMKYL